jgi:hypothetical protein
LLISLKEKKECMKTQAKKLLILEEELRKKETVEAEGQLAIEDAHKEIDTKNKKVQSLQDEITELRESNNKEAMKLREERDSAKEELDAAKTFMLEFNKKRISLEN